MMLVCQQIALRACSVIPDWGQKPFHFINAIQIGEAFWPGIIPGHCSGITEQGLRKKLTSTTTKRLIHARKRIVEHSGLQVEIE
jgi:hypothetical protein